ncbi:MAG: hypothetical protein Q9227_001658 [Pyrenula ochraceoflavens]
MSTKMNGGFLTMRRAISGIFETAPLSLSGRGCPRPVFGRPPPIQPYQRTTQRHASTRLTNPRPPLPGAANGSGWSTGKALLLSATASSLVYAYASLKQDAGSLRQTGPVYGKAAELQKAVDELRTILGEDAISTDDDDLRDHGYSEWSTINIDQLPVAVAYPKSTEEVSLIAKTCSRYRMPMVPYSGGSSLEGNFAAPFGGMSIDFAFMDEIIALHEEDMDVVVQPAIQWMQLNEKIKHTGLFFPVDPSPSAKIGGMVGTCCSGTNAMRYGTMKDWVLNLTVVLADGRIIKTRRRPRKTSAGYNLNGLFVGSEGTLGIVTEATLKLAVIPQEVNVGVVSFPSIRHAASAAMRVIRSGVPVAAMELLDEVQMSVVNRAGATGRTWKESPTLFFKFAGTKAGIQDNVKLVMDIASVNKGDKPIFAKNEEEAQDLWKARKESLWSMLSLRQEGNEVWSTDVAVPISRLPDIIGKTLFYGRQKLLTDAEVSKKEMDDLGLFASILGHIGDGNFHESIMWDKTKPGEFERVNHVVHNMVDLALDMEGTCTGEHGIGLGKKDSLLKELGADTINVMKSIKQALDPQWLLNPGKIFDAGDVQRTESDALATAASTLDQPKFLVFLVQLARLYTLTMDTLETISAISPSWVWAPEDQTRVRLPLVDMRKPKRCPGHEDDSNVFPNDTPNSQSAEPFPGVDRFAGAGPYRIGYISTADIPLEITKRGTKGSEKVNSNRITNQRLKAVRQSWWRSKRMEKAEARGLPRGAELRLYAVTVSNSPNLIRREEAARIGKPISTKRAQSPRTIKRGKGKSLAGSHYKYERPEVEEFQTFVWQDKSKKRKQFKGFFPAASSHENEAPNSHPADHSARIEPPLPTAPSSPTAHPSRDLEVISAVNKPFSGLSKSAQLDLQLNSDKDSNSKQDLKHDISSPLLGSASPSPPPSIPHRSCNADTIDSEDVAAVTKPVLHPLNAKSQQQHLLLPTFDTMHFHSGNGQLAQSLLVEAWRTWDTLQVFLCALPQHVETVDIWKALKSKGNIVSIDIFMDRRNAVVKFRPPPKDDFFLREGHKILIEFAYPPKGFKEIPVKLNRDQDARPRLRSPLHGPKRTFYPALLETDAVSIGFGVRVQEEAMAVLRTIESTHANKVQMLLNSAQKQFVIKFSAMVDAARRHYRFIVALSDMQHLFRVEHDDGKHCSVVLDLKRPPYYYREFDEEAIKYTHTKGFLVWREEDALYRQASIETSQADTYALKKSPVSLKKSRALVDLGRWKMFKVTFNFELMTAKARSTFQALLKALDDFNIPPQPKPDFEFVSRQSSMFASVDGPSLDVPNSQSLSYLERDMASGLCTKFHLSFPVRYQLEVCISNDYLNEYTVGDGFLTKLNEMSPERGKEVLEYVADLRQTFFNPMDIFELVAARLPRMHPKLPSHCNYIRTAVITPTTIIYSSPTVEMTNRVVRQYAALSDRFLRVRFEDDESRGLSRIFASSARTTNEIFTRIKRTLANGIFIGDRHFEFLAFGNSQLRDHGAYFFASTLDTTAANIRAWMGEFSQERNVAKNAARIGQCFSTTRAILQTRLSKPKRETLLPDIKHNGFVFSDGVGKMSPVVASFIAEELGLNKSRPPSAYQFRQGGCKGVLAIDPELKLFETQIRDSQFKFETKHHGMEIIRCSEFWAASLSRQIILLLSFLGVTDEVFLTKQKELIASLENAMHNDDAAIDALHASIDPNRMTIVLSSMVSEGFRGTNEPFVTSLLRLWRAWSLKYLKEKAKITVRKGACVLGVVDETATLQGYRESQQAAARLGSSEEKEGALPEIFIQVEKADSPGHFEVIEGICFLGRSPALHPGDIRVVRAVDCPRLHHLRDVVVLPQTGDRDISSMCSGGDLDGDDYFVVWDPDLIPREWFHEPMDFSTKKENMPEKDVTMNDISTFFVNYIKNDFLGVIAHAHMAWADDPRIGLNHPKCLELAKLHSDAVDFNKSGQPAAWDRAHNPKEWPHFMEKKHKKQRKSYNVLGQLYDAVEKVAFVPNYEAPFNERILSAFEPSADALKKAKELKERYDADMQRIMSQHEIKTEFEVWSTFVLDHSKASKDFKFHEEIGRLSESLKERFQKACVDISGGDDFLTLAPFVTAMYKVTQMETNQAVREIEAGIRDSEPMPFMSFPWLFLGILADIANGRRHKGQAFIVSRDGKSKIEDDFEVKTGIKLSAEDKRGLAAGVTRIRMNPETKLTEPASTLNHSDLGLSFSSQDRTAALLSPTAARTATSRPSFVENAEYDISVEEEDLEEIFEDPLEGRVDPMAQLRALNRKDE